MIIMPRDVNIIVSGHQSEDGITKSQIKYEINTRLRKISRIVRVISLKLNIHKYQIKGRRIKYSVKGSIKTEWGEFFAQAWAWEITKAVSETLKELERIIIKKKECSEKHEIDKALLE